MTQTAGNAPAKHKLGEILIRKKIISPDQLAKALDVQRSEKGYLGETLIRLGFVEERDILVALVVQCNLPYIAVQNYSVDKGIVNLIPEAVAKQYYVVPLDRVGNILSVVMADPLNEEIKTELIKLTQCKIAPFIATKAEIVEAIKRLYA
jgi:type IV pilus assembly protein PilB